MHTPRREAPSAPPLGELLSECEAEGVRNEIWGHYKIRTTPSQSARSGCQLSQRESQGRFAPNKSFAPNPFGEGVADMTFTELCQFCLVLIGLADLIVRIIKKK